MKVEPFLIASTLNCILAQRLARKLCEEKEKYFLNESDIKDVSKYCKLDRILEVLREEKLATSNQSLNTIPFFRPKPTKKCPEGYKGRVGIFEVLPVTESIKKLIVEQAASDQIQFQAQKEGMRTMIEDGFVKAAQGMTSIEEILRVIIE
jgi:type IV pilus assembly protein PilB